jgi:hypothetical protein
MARLRAILREHGPLLFVLTAFVVSRAYYRIGLGARFDASPYTFFLQFADPELLRTDLLRTCLYLHHQGPLLDLLIGLTLKVAPTHIAEVLDACFLVGGAALAVGLHAVLRDLGVRGWVRAIAGAAYVASPVVVFYEMWLLYHHVVTVFMVLAAAALLRFLRTEKVLSGVAFFSYLVLVVLTRSVYGLVWTTALLGVLLVIAPVPRRLVLRAAVVPFLFLVAYTVKTPLLVGRSLGHAMLAPNVVQKILGDIPSLERERLFKEHLISPMEKVVPFYGLDKGAVLRLPQPPTGVPILDETQTSTGAVNSNCSEYLALADVAKQDARYLLLHYPRAYANSVVRAVTVGYLHSATTDVWVPRTRIYRALAPADRKMSAWMGATSNGRLIALMIAVPLSLLYAIHKLVSVRAWLVSQRSTTAVIAIMFVTIIYVGLSTSLVSWNDFSRYRFEVDPFYAVLFTLGVESSLRWVKRLGARASRWRSRRRAVAALPAALPEASGLTAHRR